MSESGRLAPSAGAASSDTTSTGRPARRITLLDTLPTRSDITAP
jgi:hypothetical protein